MKDEEEREENNKNNSQFLIKTNKDGYTIKKVNTKDNSSKYYFRITSYKNDTYQSDYFDIRIHQSTWDKEWKNNEQLFYDCHRQFICFYEIRDKDKFWVVTCDGHPAVETSSFSYDNSDGSGPDLIYPPDDFDKIYKGFYDEFNEFCRNNYH